MDYLKQYISANLFAIYGYWVFLYSIYTLIHGDLSVIFHPFGMGYIIYHSIINLLIFFAAFICEFLVLFILKLIIKKNTGLNIQNTIHDIIFRLGIALSFVPLIVIMTLIFDMVLGSIITLLDDSWIGFLAQCFIFFDFFIKYIFFKKYFDRTKNV